MKLVGTGVLDRFGTKKQEVQSKLQNSRQTARKLTALDPCPISCSGYAITIGQNVSRHSWERPSRTCLGGQNMPMLLLTSLAGASSSKRTSWIPKLCNTSPSESKKKTWRCASYRTICLVTRITDKRHLMAKAPASPRKQWTSTFLKKPSLTTFTSSKTTARARQIRKPLRLNRSWSTTQCSSRSWLRIESTW